jgi:hypothetical protein
MQNSNPEPQIAAGVGHTVGTSTVNGVGQAVGSSAGTGVGASAPADTPPAKRIRSTKTKHRPGVLQLKEYPITEDTLDNIGTLRVSAAFWFAVGSLALGFALSAWQSHALAGNDVDAAAKATWAAYRTIGVVVAVVSYVAGGFYFWKGKSVIQFVKDNTTHDPID